MADRYLYIPMIGISMMVAWGIPSLIPEMPGKNAFLGAASTVCVTILAVLCWIQTGYWKNSGTLFEHTLKVAGSSPIGHSSLGQWYFSQQNLDAAIEQFEKAIELNPMVVLPRMNLGLALNLKGKYQEAFEQVDEAAKLAPNNYEVQHSLGVVLASLGRFDEAVKAHEKAIEISPEYSAAHNDLGLLYLQQDKLDKAIEQLAFAMRYDPEAVFIRVNLSNALLKNGKPMDALQLAGSALQIRKDFPEGYIAAANALIALKKFDQVGPYLQAAFQLAGKNPRLQGLVMKSTVEFSQAVADANLQTGKVADAIGNYQDALKIAPNDPRLHNSLGSAYAMSGNIEEAIKEFNETFRLDPKSAEAKRNLGQAYLSQDKAKEAVEAFRTAIELAPDWPVPKNDLAWVLATYPNEEFRNGKEAVELAETACKQVGVDSPEFLDTLAAAYAESGDFAKAVANATKAADIALKAGRVAQSEELSKRLDQYKAGQPYHVEPTKPPESPAPPVSDTPAPDNGGALGEPALGTEPLDLGEPLIPAPGEPVQGITP
jgi:tetratricopeptide (TPR) repeat protein